MEKIKIAVISPYRRHYITYINCFPENEEREYFWVYSLDSLYGQEFDSFVKLKEYEKIDRISDILYHLERFELSSTTPYQKTSHLYYRK